MPQESHLHGIDILSLAACHLEYSSPSKNTLGSTQAVQSAHRLRILKAWADGDGEDPDWTFLRGHVLDAGCGQGDQTAAIAAVMGHIPALKGSLVNGVDPGPPDYGSPFTLQESQAHLLKSTLAKNICFETIESHGSTRKALERHESNHYQSVVFSHSLWYFPGRGEIFDAFSAAREHGARYLLIAEWDLSCSRSTSLPHLLAVFLQMNSALSKNNVRMPLSPPTIKEIAENAGWTAVHERTLVTAPELQDGRWEVHAAASAAKEYLQLSKDDTCVLQESASERGTIESQLYALEKHLPLDKGQITSLDVWTCKFVPTKQVK